MAKKLTGLMFLLVLILASFLHARPTSLDEAAGQRQTMCSSDRLDQVTGLMEDVASQVSSIGQSLTSKISTMEIILISQNIPKQYRDQTQIKIMDELHQLVPPGIDHNQNLGNQPGREVENKSKHLLRTLLSLDQLKKQAEKSTSGQCLLLWTKIVDEHLVSITSTLKQLWLSEQRLTFLLQQIQDQAYARNVIQSTTEHSCMKGTTAIAASDKYPYPIVYPVVNIPFLCDATTYNGRWIVFQRRSNQSFEFYRGWEDYKNGFGSLDNDYWLGLVAVHNLTSRGHYELRVDLKYGDKAAFAHYGSFRIEGEDENFRLRLGHYRGGTAGDSLSHHNGMKFSTKDKDNDKLVGSCATKYPGGWWYKYCVQANLNGQWLADDYKGLVWVTFAGTDSLTFSEMKIRLVGGS